MKYVVALAVAILLFATRTALDSCAISPPEPVFMTRSGPAEPQAEFFQGKIGVIVPSFRESYLIAAYRYLSGRTFSAEEVHAFLNPATAPPGGIFPSSGSSWIQARIAFRGRVPVSYVEAYKTKSGPGYFANYRNCLDDAFATATITLADRASRWGNDSPNFREWIDAQDQVFQDCSAKAPAIPADPAPAMDPLLAADREYQIAAAYFYAGDWENSRRWFQRVAQNANSPWRDIAPYLIARTYLREGMLDEKPDALQEADRRFEAIVNDPSQQKWHNASSSLLDFTASRIHSWERLTQYAAELSGERPSEDLGGHLQDYIFLFDHANDKSRLATTSDMADWLLTLRKTTNGAASHALDRWRTSHHHAWLIAALSFAKAYSDTDLTELMQAAHQIQPDDPAYESAAYYGIDIEISKDHRDQARQWADQALNRKLLLSSRNRILAERMKLARNWNDFLTIAPRRPEPHLQAYDDQEVSEEAPWAKLGDLFAEDSTTVLNRNVPLVLLADGARNSQLPKRLQMSLAQMGFIRSLVLGQTAQMKDFMQQILQLNPAFAGIAHDILTAPDAQSAHFAGVFLLLRTSAPEAFLYPDASQPSDFHRAHNPGSIYWGFDQPFAHPPLFATNPTVPVDLGFLTTLQRAQADLEWNALQQEAGCGATFAEEEALQWAVKHPDDARVPEALYYTVQATRRGCRDIDSTRVGKRSKQAFQLLHQRYPNSEWTKKTKYWFN